MMRAPRRYLHVGVKPLHEDGEAVPGADEEEEVDEKPHEPGDEAVELHPHALGDGVAAADRGHAALVKITELGPDVVTPAAQALDLFKDDLGGMASHLHGGGQSPGTRLPA